MSTSSVLPPVAKTAPYTFTHLGHEFQDPYAWLQNKEDPEVLAYLAAENEYARAVMKHTGGLQEELYAEMRGRLQEDERSAPERRGAYLYYWRMEPGKQYRIFCRKAVADDAAEEILLDENKLAEGHTYCKVRSVEPSPDHNLIAYAVDFTGAWVWDLYVKDLHTGELVSGPIANTAYSSAWANDNRSLFYTVFDHAHRACKVFCHTVGQADSRDREVYHEPDAAFDLHLQRARSGAFLVLTIASNSASEVRYLAADQPDGSFALVEPRRPWIEYYVEHHGERFWVWTNEDAENFRLMAAPADTPGRENWREVLPLRADTLLEEVHGFDDFLVLVERRGGLTQLRISAPDAVTDVRYVTFPDAAYMVAMTANPEASSQVLRFQYSSMITPDVVVDYDVRDGAWAVVKQLQIPSGYDASQYTSERIFATSHDGAQVPISLVYRKGTRRDGTNPLLLYGYGSYGYSQEANFQTNRLSLIDRGYVYAVAHIRGGSEMGRAWYDQGRLLHKKNSFYDFIACAEHLITQGYTRPQKLAMMGGSAGGLLVAAVTNLRPDLFKAVVALVPFTNVITAILTPDLPLTVTEYDQWGHPDSQEAFDYMLSYSPYENVERKAYPHILARAGLNDLQVPYWDPAKWVAKLRSHKTDQNRLVLLTNMASGHGGSSGRYNYLREVAENYAFLLDTLPATD